MIQSTLFVSKDYTELDDYFERNNSHSVLLVCGNSIHYLKIKKYFERLEDRRGIKVVRFSGFKPNPSYESVIEGLKSCKESHCDSIVAVGGGSAMDVAKCIKLFLNSEGDGADGSYLSQPVIHNSIKLLAIPTTAGTGSEATRYAVVYFNGEKQSLSDESIIPTAVLFDPSVLESLPAYQKKSTMLDALCHGIESFWSVNSTDESKRYSKDSIRLILKNMDGYLSGNGNTYEPMLRAANMAGKAINITQTTAGHAMCYKLTSMYGITHGHAAALCVRALWPWMIEHIGECIDARGKEYLEKIFKELSDTMGCITPHSAAEKFASLIDRLSLPALQAGEDDYNILKTSVNPVRLKNHPISLDEKAIDYLYHRILSG